MADEMDDYEDFDSAAQQDERPSGLRKKLAEATKRAQDRDTLAEENQRLKQQLAVSDAGLSLTDVQRKALLAVTDDLNPEALKKTAADLGFVQQPPPPSDHPDLDRIEQLAQASAGTDVPPVDRQAEYEKQVAAARTEAEVMEIVRAFGKPVAH